MACKHAFRLTHNRNKRWKNSHSATLPRNVKPSQHSIPQPDKYFLALDIHYIEPKFSNWTNIFEKECSGGPKCSLKLWLFWLWSKFWWQTHQHSWTTIIFRYTHFLQLPPFVLGSIWCCRQSLPLLQLISYLCLLVLHSLQQQVFLLVREVDKTWLLYTPPPVFHMLSWQKFLQHWKALKCVTLVHTRYDTNNMHCADTGHTLWYTPWTVFVDTQACCNDWCKAGCATVEPPNKGHGGTRSCVLYKEVSYSKLKCTGIIGIGTSGFVLYREVFFIRSVLYRRFNCIQYLHKGAERINASRHSLVIHAVFWAPVVSCSPWEIVASTVVHSMGVSIALRKHS